jgi:lipid-A-disaccharide synthase
MVIAGEPSGDILAAELVTAMNAVAATQHGHSWRFFGAGGARMRDAGVELAVDMTAHAVVGIWEVLKHYPELKGIFNRLLNLAKSRLPDVIVLVDYPGFNLRFTAAVKKWVRSLEGSFNNWRPKIVYYVSPQIWAWHSSRVRQIARDVDLMLSIFPFEKAWYAERAPGFRVEYVGHPLVDRYALEKKIEPIPTKQMPPLVLLLPGSRTRELNKHLPVMLESARRFHEKLPVNLRMVLPNQRLKDLATAMAAGCPWLQLQVGGLAESLREAELAIASSGTVTMECAWFCVPTIVMYRTSWSTYALGKRFIHVPFLAMPNLLAKEAVYPELIQNEATPDAVSRLALDLLTHAEKRELMRRKLSEVMASLGPPGASRRAATILMPE